MFFARTALTCVLFDVTVYGTTWQFSTQLSRPVFYLLLSQFMASLGSFPRSCPVLSSPFTVYCYTSGGVNVPCIYSHAR